MRAYIHQQAMGGPSGNRNRNSLSKLSSPGCLWSTRGRCCVGMSREGGPVTSHSYLPLVWFHEKMQVWHTAMPQYYLQALHPQFFSPQYQMYVCVLSIFEQIFCLPVKTITQEERKRRTREIVREEIRESQPELQREGRRRQERERYRKNCLDTEGEKEGGIYIYGTGRERDIQAVKQREVERERKREQAIVGYESLKEMGQ